MKTSAWLRTIALTISLAFAGSNALFAQAVDVSHYPSDPSVLPGKGPTNYWSGLPATWARRHAEWAKTSDQDHNGVVFLGDSITQGWNSLAQDFPGLKTVNRGIGGDSTRGVLYRLDADVLSLQPRAVVLLIGTNDIGNSGANPSDVADNIVTIIKEIHHRYPHIPIVVCEVMPSSETKQRPADKIEELNKLIKKDVRWKSHTYLCDTWSIFADANGDAPKELFPDLLHPNAAGYAKWKAALLPVFAKANIQMTE